MSAIASAITLSTPSMSNGMSSGADLFGVASARASILRLRRPLAFSDSRLVICDECIREAFQSGSCRRASGSTIGCPTRSTGRSRSCRTVLGLFSKSIFSTRGVHQMAKDCSLCGAKLASEEAESPRKDDDGDPICGTVLALRCRIDAKSAPCS